jgi:pimeloyl-ACP methyl ester carboxylesterase
MSLAVAHSNTDVRAFQVDIAQDAIDDMKRRVAATRWPTRENVSDETQGVRLATMQAVAAHWTTHDWRRFETHLNSFPQFLLEIDGLDIHFIHVRSKHENALPILITHGWPGSVVEQLKIIGPMTDPTAFGGTAEDAFDVVIPSLPGYGFSGKPTEPAKWVPTKIAQAWAELMSRLGYNRYVAQGGDWGNAVTETMSSNMSATVPPEISSALAAGSPPPQDLLPDERRAWEQLDFFYKKGLGYANEMALRPQTLYGLEDSPIGLAAWMIDHDAASQALIGRIFAGESAGLTKDDIIDNVSFYWLTGTAISSARLYWDNSQVPSGGFFDTRGIQLPMSVTVFPDEIYAAPERWARRAYPNLIFYKRHDVGGHYAAWEQPQLLAGDLRESFRSFR